MGISAQEWHARAVEASVDGRNTQAERLLDRAWAQASDPDLQARILGTRALVQRHRGLLDDAERTCAQARSITPISAHTRAVLDGQLGAVALLRGDLSDAERLLSAAVAGLDDDAVAAARVRINRSVTRLQRHALAAAASDLDVAADVLAAHALPADEGQARHNRGYISLLQGDLIGALQQMRQARPLAATSPLTAAIGDMDRAEVLRDAGLSHDAEQLLAQVAALFGHLRMPQLRAQADFHRARSLLSHDAQKAAVVAARAARGFRAVGNDAWMLRSDALRLRARLHRAAASGAARGGPRMPASDAVDRTVHGLRRVGFADDAHALRLSEDLARVRRDPAAASARAPRIPEGAALPVRLLAHEVRATRALVRGRWAAATAAAAAGVDDLSSWKESFGSLDLQTSVAMHGTGLILAGLEAAVRSGRPDVVFEWSERARHLSQQAVPLRPPRDAAAADALARLRAMRSDDIDALAGADAERLREIVRAHQWTGTGTSRIRPRVGIAEVEAALGDDTAVLALVFSGRRVCALALTSRTRALIDLGAPDRIRALMAGLRADLDMRARVRIGPIAEVVATSLRARLDELSSLLLDPAREVIGDRRLVLTAPGLLAGVPWAMLPVLRERTFTLAPSVSGWVHERRVAAGSPRRFGAVVGPRVARGEEEAHLAARAWAEASVLSGGEATTEAAVEMAGGVDVLHLIAHGHHVGDNPLFSGLDLADGTLFGYDVDQVERVPATVVLSACEVGRSAVRWGEEAVGMARVWLHAGAGAVVASPVAVADDDACELMGVMQERLAAGDAPSLALATAQTRTGLVTPFHVHGVGF